MRYIYVMAKTTTAAVDIIERELGEVLGEKYLSYALSTIMARSLPDVRDGLKPVHRRLLYAMAELNLKPEGAPKKSARVVGDVIGKYHPHGDQAVYDALVRLAQDFAARYPLVDGQGNFGNIDGDNAAAMRYTEARLTAVAWALLEGIDEDAVDFRETYDGELREPVVLPAAFPNLLANGATGIAVGMATSIPPHNVGELCDAIVHLIQTPKATVKDLLKFIQGPDFPTGGILVEDKASIRAAYETGRGGFRVRARWEKESLKQGQYQIVVTEIPYQVQKSRLVEKIAELIHARKLPMLEEIHDESAEDIRLVLIPKNRNVEADLLMESLFRTTDLESRFSLNMNVLDQGVRPQVMDLRQVLQAFIDHRREVLVRRSNFRLGKIAHRLEVLEGYLVAYLNLDAVIKIIRNDDDPKTVLMKRFKITEVQAEAILNMRLRALRKLEEIEIKAEHKALLKEKDELEKLVASKARQSTALRKQIEEIKEKLDDARRTEIGKPPKLVDIPDEAMIEKEPVTVVCSEKGWIRAMKGHLKEDQVADLKYKEGDKERFVLPAETTDKLIAFGTNGRFYTIDVSKLPAGRGFGEPVRLMIELGNDADLVSLMKHDPERRLLIAADTGHGFIVTEKDVVAQTKNGKQVLNVKGDAEGRVCIPVAGDHVAVIGQNRKLLLFPLEEVPELARGRGVILQRYKDGGLSDLKTFTLAEGFGYPYKGGVKVLTGKDLEPWLGKRAQAGRLPPNGFPRANRFK